MAKSIIRNIRVCGDIAYVPLTKGYEAIISACDVQLVASKNWFVNIQVRKNGTISNAYAVRMVASECGGRKMEFMHRVISKTPTGMYCDHIDGNGLNNLRENLRNVTHVQNMMNQKIASNNRTGVKGVSRVAATGKWKAQIAVGGSMKYLGVFETIQEAARAYEIASKKFHGDFGRIK